MNDRECTKIFVDYGDSRFTEIRDTPSEESSKCFIENQEDNYKTVNNPKVYDINSNYIDSRDINPDDRIIKQDKVRTKVESEVQDLPINHADKQKVFRDSGGFHNTSVEDERIVCYGQSLLRLNKIKSRLYNEEGKQFRQLQTTLLRFLSKYNVSDTKYSLLLKYFYITLYDNTNCCPVASFEYLEKNHRWGNRKSKRQIWKDDSVKNSLFDEENQAFERGHFVRHGNWNYSKDMVSEMFFLTNAFPQIKHFQAYVDVEQFGLMLSKRTDVFIITCLTNDCERIVKIFRWTHKNSTVLLMFDFPNTEQAFANLTPKEKRYGGHFVTKRSILRQLPFKMIDIGDVNFIQEAPVVHRAWKESIIKLIGRD